MRLKQGRKRCVTHKIDHYQQWQEKNWKQTMDQTPVGEYVSLILILTHPQNINVF